MDKIFFGYPCSELLYNNKKKKTIDTNNMSESQNHVEWKKSQRVHTFMKLYLHKIKESAN